MESPQHNRETMSSHFDLLRAWLDSFFVPDCQEDCNTCLFHVIMEDFGKPVKVASRKAGEAEYFTICTALEAIRNTVSKGD